MLEISTPDFDKIRDLMYKLTGVHMKPTKKTLVSTRLRTRLEDLKISLADYIKLIERPGSTELEVFINALTTNETYFFRHTKQFNFLFEKALPAVKEQNASKKQITIWTAACSTGEEPYSIAITCKEFLKNSPGWKFKIFASDVNSQVIAASKEAVYSERSIKEVPQTLLKKYFDCSEFDARRNARKYKVLPEIKNHVEFFQHNLLAQSTKTNIDIIFLRNVMIYFDPTSKQKVLNNIQSSLTPTGYFFISLSENLNDIQTGFKSVFSSVYQKA